MKNTFLLLLLMCTFVASAQVEEEVIDAVIEAEESPPPPPAPQPEVRPSLNKPKTEKLRGYRGKSGGRYGFYFNSTWMIPPEYDALPKKYSNFMIAGKNKKYGVIDSENNVIVPLEYDKITRILKDWETKEETGYYSVEKGDLKGILSKTGDFVIPVQYTTLTKNYNQNYCIGNEGETYGVVTIEGKEIIPSVYESPVSLIRETDRYRTTKNGLIGEINRKQETVLPFIYQSIDVRKGKLIFRIQDKWGVMTKDYKELVAPKYDGVNVRHNGIIIVKEGELYGAFNATKRQIISTEYKSLELFHPRYFKAAKGKYQRPAAVIDTTGRMILPAEFDGIKRGGGDIIFAKKVRQGREIPLYAAYDKDGKQIVPPTFVHIGNLNVMYSKVNKESSGKYALIDSKGNVVTPYAYNNLRSRMLSREPLTFQISAERDGYKGTLKPDGTENDDFKSTAPQRDRQRQKDQNREQRIFKGLVGEWYGVENIDGQEYLTNISILSNTTGIRTVYYLEKGKECRMEQYFSPALLSTMNTMLMKFNSREMNVKCSNPPAAFNLRNDAFFRGNTFSLSGGMNKIGIKNYARKETPASEEDSFEVLRTIKRMYPIAKDLVSKIEKRPGGISNPKVTISPTTKKVKLITYSIEEIGAIELKKEGGYIFLPGKWQKKTSFALSGILRNVRYRDENGVEKVGDLDICFDAMSSQPHAFKELVK